MEKNITPNQKLNRPSFWHTFVYVFSIFLILQLIFGRKNETLPTINPLSKTKPQKIARKLIPFSTDSLNGNFNSVGLRVDDVILKKYKVSLDKNSKNIELLKYIDSEKNSNEKSSYMEFGFIPTGDDLSLFPTNATIWNVVSHTNNSVTLSWKNSRGLTFQRLLTFDNDYMLTVTDTIKNNSQSEVSFYPYARIVASNNMSKPVSNSHTGFIAYLGNNLHEEKYQQISSSKPLEFNSNNGWLGFTSDYFMTILVPSENSKSFTARVLKLPQTTEIKTKSSEQFAQFQSDYVKDIVIIPSKSDITIVNHAYIGAKVPSIISKYETEYSIPKFDLVIDYGYFYILSKPFTIILKWFYELTGNFGFAIILFTLLIRLLLFPIAQKSFKSMKKMKEMQPEMKRIQTMYANNKPMMNMQLAMLYKKSGINPLSGCLPLLIQIPVFFALYKSLIISIEMRQAPFILWIHDLSAPDPTSIFNLFGLLPFTQYSWLPSIGVLPLLMGISMYIQQKMQPVSGMDPTQMKMMHLLPWIFVIVFAGFPSGLLLYWIVNNILSILQQKFIK